METNQKTWLGKLLAKIVEAFSASKTEFHDFAVVADNLANMVKTAEASTVGQLFETGIEMAIPASTGLVEAFKLYWPKLITVLNLAVAESGKSDQQIAVDGAIALAKMKAADANAYAGTMTNISANIKQFFLDNTGAGGTIQQGLITQVVTHDPSLLSIIGNVAEEAIAPAEIAQPGAPVANSNVAPVVNG